MTASQGIMEAGIGNESEPYQTSALDSGSDAERADPTARSDPAAQESVGLRSRCHPGSFAADSKCKCPRFSESL